MKRSIRHIGILFIGFLLVTGSAFGGKDKKPYDEVFDKSGEVRPHYAEVYKIYSEYSPTQLRRIMKKSVQDFSGDNALFPFPRLLTREEYEVLRKGLVQRATAQRMFLEDFYSGKKRAVKAGVVPTDVITRAMHRSSEEGWIGNVNPEQIAFVSGSDIFRDPKGNFRFGEDNSNFVGCIGDLIVANKTLFKYIPDYENAISAPDPASFYKRLFARARLRAVPANGIVVLVQYVHELAADNEDRRTAKLFKDLGAEIVYLNPNAADDSLNKKRLVTRKDGVYLETRKSSGKVSLQRVGFVMSNVEPYNLDTSHPASHRQLVVAKMRENLASGTITDKKLRKRVEENMDDSEVLEHLGNEIWGEGKWLGGEGIKGLFQAQFDGKVAMNVSPGNEFINDKEFYIYMDDLIRFYLKEEPVVTNIRARSFGNTPGLLKEVFGNLGKFVIKRVDGRGGDAVWVGPKMDQSKKARNKVKALIEAEPDAFIAQDYLPLSVFAGYLGDLRLFADVTPHSVFVAETPIGRVTPIDSDGKVNLSLEGSESAVFVVDPPERCDAKYQELLLTKK